MSRHTVPGARLNRRQLLLCVTWARVAACPHPRPVESAAGPPGAGHAEGRNVEQRDTVRRYRRYLGWRAHPPVASAGFLRLVPLVPLVPRASWPAAASPRRNRGPRSPRRPPPGHGVAKAQFLGRALGYVLRRVLGVGSRAVRRCAPRSPRRAALNSPAAARATRSTRRYCPRGGGCSAYCWSWSPDPVRSRSPSWPPGGWSCRRRSCCWATWPCSGRPPRPTPNGANWLAPVRPRPSPPLPGAAAPPAPAAPPATGARRGGHQHRGLPHPGRRGALRPVRGRQAARRGRLSSCPHRLSPRPVAALQGRVCTRRTCGPRNEMLGWKVKCWSGASRRRG